MPNPVLFALESDADSRARLQDELEKRYGADYDIVCLDAAHAALDRLQALQAAGVEVVAILSDCRLQYMDGEAFLQRARALHPQARRALLTAEGDTSATAVITHASAMGTIDAFTRIPVAGAADEEFHYVVSRLLREWARENRPPYLVARIVGQRWARRSHELRDLFQRNTLPFAFYDADSDEGRALLKEADAEGDELPVIVLADGQVLSDPSVIELAQALDVSSITDISGVPTDEVVDVVIIGAGPAGLSAAVYGSSEGLHTVLVEREAIGGQAGMSSRIRNYMGFPMGITGGELAARAYQQAWLFGTDFTFGQEAVGLQVDGEERVVLLSDGTQLRTRTVVLAMGVSYRRLDIPSLDALIGAGVFYGAAGSEAAAMKDEPVYVVGAGNSAGQAALHLARYAQQVTILVRGRSLSTSMSEYLIKEVENTANIAVRTNTEVVGGGGDYRLQRLVLANRDSGQEETVRARALFVLIGATPHTAWLPDTVKRAGAGYIVTGTALLEGNGVPWPLQRAPLLFETSIPGVFAAGDVRLGSPKRVAAAVGEGAVAIGLVHQYLG